MEFRWELEELKPPRGIVAGNGTAWKSKREIKRVNIQVLISKVGFSCPQRGHPLESQVYGAREESLGSIPDPSLPWSHAMREA